MKKLIITLFSLFIISNSLSAQSSKLFGSLGGGLSVPTGDFELAYNSGFNIAGNMGMVIDKMFGGRIDIQYNSFPYKGTSSIYGNITGDPYSVFTLGADVIISNYKDLKKQGAIIPYGFAGLYFVNAKPGNTKITTTYSSTTYSYDSESKVAIGIGGGATYKLSSNIGISAELKYTFTLGGSQLNYIPLRVALSFTP